MHLSVVIPAYNEDQRLPATLRQIISFLSDSERWLPAEIIVVDDGSSDETSTVSDRFDSVELLSIRCLRHPRNQGKGAAVRTGFSASTGRLILLSDADLATPIEELDTLATAACKGIVIGSRAVDRSRIEVSQPRYRDLMGRVFNLAVRTLAVRGILDTQCGFKLFDGPIGRALAEAQRIDGFAFDVEHLARARSSGFELREIAVRWRHVEESRVQPVIHSAEMFSDLLRIGWWRLTGRLAIRKTSVL
jgi:dolichyl-phosphate beta-glucosyltransferase